MNATDIHKTYKSIIRAIGQHDIVKALDQLGVLSKELYSTELNNKLEAIRQSYIYLLQYFIEGVEDPQRINIYHKIIADLYQLAAWYRELLLTRLSTNYEFLQIRHFAQHTQFSIEEIRNGLDRDTRLLDCECENQSEKRENIQQEYEQIVKYLFHYYWLKSKYDNDALRDIYQEIMDDSYQDKVAKSIIISALTLNLWRTFDTSKILLLLDACASNDPNVSQRAWVGIVFVLSKYNAFIPYFPMIENQLKILIDDPRHGVSLRHIILQIITTTETEALNQRFRDEVYPELMKIKPLIEEKENIEDLFKTDEWGEVNPDWKDIMKEHQVVDKIQEFIEMGITGSDVYLDTFAQFKSFPFFNTISNWFIPFETQQSSISSLFTDEEKTLLYSFVNTPMMCNSDKYSLCLNMTQMPIQQRKIMEKNFGDAANQQIEDMTSQTTESKGEIISRHYIQDLFRFFRLNVNRKDFSDMFLMAQHLHKTHLFELLSSSNEKLKQEVAEYYFSKKLYTAALELYEQIETNTQNTAATYQRIGYAFQQSSQIEKALLAYQKADLIAPDDFWTNRKIAMCYRLLGDKHNAITTYRLLKEQRPNNISVRLQLANLLQDTGETKQALDELIEAHTTYPQHTEILRNIIQIALYDHHIAQAQYYQSLLFEIGEYTPQDYLVAGHIAWIMNKNNEAKKYYQKAFEVMKKDREMLNALFEKTKQILQENGVEAYEVTFIAAAIKME